MTTATHKLSGVGGQLSAVGYLVAARRAVPVRGPRHAPKRALLTVGIMLLAALTGCSDEVVFEHVSIDETQTRYELVQRGIVVPDTYTFVSMIKMPPPGSGGISYQGVFTSPAPAAPVLLDSRPLALTPAPCQQLQGYELPNETKCAEMADVHQGAATLAASLDDLTVITGRISPGLTRIYLSIAGH